VLSGILSICFGLNQVLPTFAANPLANPATRSPIKHLIVVVGENRSFDNVFGTYTSPDPNQTVLNLLSEGLVDQTGFPPGTFTGASYTPLQNQATDTSSITRVTRGASRGTPAVIAESSFRATAAAWPRMGRSARALSCSGENGNLRPSS